MRNNNLLFGIIGGMGTAAGIELQKLVADTFNANSKLSDQDYPEWIYINASKAPDRTAAIKGDGPSPEHYLSGLLQELEPVGVDAVIVACNTVHAFYDKIFSKVNIPWIHLQYETARYLADRGIKEAGIMATEGTIIKSLFGKAFGKFSLNAIEPELSSRIQKMVMSAIYNPSFGIKYTGSKVSSEAKKQLEEAISLMNVDYVIAGCTELSLAFSQMEMKVNYYDPMKIAAKVMHDLYTGYRSLESLQY